LANFRFRRGKPVEALIASPRQGSIEKEEGMHRFMLIRREDGQTMAEYGVVLAVITVALVALFVALSGEIGAALTAVSKALPG
jgi:Flp pilus assembly pilin Flp